MHPNKPRLKGLPSIPELDARAEEALGQADTQEQRITKITCQLLEKDMLRGNSFSPILTPIAHIVEGDIVCQRYERTASKPRHVGGFFGIGGTLLSGSTRGCLLMYLETKDGTAHYRECPFKGLKV